MLNLSYIKNYSAPVRMFSFLLMLILLWMPGVVFIYVAVGRYRNLADPGTQNLLTILTMGLLVIEFTAFLPWWGRQVYQHSNLFYRYGFSITRKNGILLLKGLLIGICVTFCLFFIQGIFGWLTWQSPRLAVRQLILEGAATAFGVGLFEGAFFRGWMLDELERDYSLQVSLIVNAGLFAVLHFLKPPSIMLQSLPQFPGLFLLGMVLVIAKRQHGNLLGLSIGLHVGIVWTYYIINVGKIAEYSGRVSDWVTGINGNPLSGLLGLIFMAILAIVLAKFPKR